MSKLIRTIRAKIEDTDIIKSKGFYKLLFFAAGFFATLWFLIRVIPKPSRAGYPCLKATMPLAYSFMAYLLSITGSLVFFRRAVTKLRQRQLRYAVFAFSLAGFLGTWAIIHNQQKASAVEVPTEEFTDPLGPNEPIGEAKGIFPGRVVWVWDANATNEDLIGHEDYYWDDSYTDMSVVDQMVTDGILALTEEETEAEAWDAIFRHFNENHGKGDTGYIDTETVFIKINAVTAWGGAWPNGEWNSGRNIEYDTSPQMILAMLRQLVNHAGVPQDKICMADPLADIYNHIYNYLVAEFPDVHYCSQYGIPNRDPLTPGSEVAIHFADGGSIMAGASNNEHLFEEMMNADYLLNIPTLKGHRWAGVTFIAKNHFGSNTYDGSWYMHPGLINNDNQNMRTDYTMYRVLVELMGSRYLGQKTLLYTIEGLWSTSYEHQPAQKFRTAPFNNDYCSSILFSQDPVAIESVGIDILQKEFKVEEIDDGMDEERADRWTFVQFGAIDDYLHQAASSEWWPNGITYDPDNSGTPIPSLGVHEHWNNEEEMEYSRNLGTGEGIELVKVFHLPNSTFDRGIFALNMKVFPNPVQDILKLEIPDFKGGMIGVGIYSSEGKQVDRRFYEAAAGHGQIELDLSRLETGLYILSIETVSSLYAVSLYKE